MKILLASHCFYPSTGGIETVTDLLAREFRERGHEVRVVTQTKGEAHSPYEVIRCPSSADLWLLLRWCDVFLQNNISLRSLWPALLLRRPLFIIHQTWLRPPGQKASLAESVKRIALKRATNISISNAVAASLDVPSTVIGNPFDDRTFRDLGEARDQDLVFVGRLVSDKGADVLLAALKQLRESGQIFRLTIVGDGPEREQLRTLARNSGLAEQIDFVGTQRPPELAAILNRHRLLVVPSRWPEPFGIVAVEGIASGCAVVGSSEGGLPEAIGPCGMTFPNGDAAALAREISALMNRDRQQQLLEAAPAHLAKFHRASVAAQYPSTHGSGFVILVTHPTGNANVRAVLDAFYSEGVLERFVTTIAFSRSSHPYLSDHIRGKLRRNYALPDEKIDIHPAREAIRLLAGFLGMSGLTRHETGWASPDQVYRSLDRLVAARLRRKCYGERLKSVYAYEDCAAETFAAARDLNLRRIYDLPIAYWETAQRLLREEAQRYPDWEPTLGGTRDSDEKLQRKTREMDLAELVICPSRFVLDSIPESARGGKRCVSVAFGSPQVGDVRPRPGGADQNLRVLFAGAMTQRKGLADVFAAMKMVSSPAIELVVMGSLIKPLEWYRERCPGFTYESPRPHRDFLELMRSCDVLVLPSIVEGRALVQQEAMACGLPVIATMNAGADDLIVNGESGFLVPIRSPQAIAEKLDWCAANRQTLAEMGREAQRRAGRLTWQEYGATVARQAIDLTSGELPAR